MTKAIDEQVGGGHYKAMKIQPIEFCHANSIPFVEGNIIKYVCRWRSKNGVEDLKKARHMLDMLIELEVNLSQAGGESIPGRRHGMRSPNLILADSLRNHPELWPETGLPDGRWVVARPLSVVSFWCRCVLAWGVFTGKYDALRWIEYEDDRNPDSTCYSYPVGYP